MMECYNSTLLHFCVILRLKTTNLIYSVIIFGGSRRSTHGFVFEQEFIQISTVSGYLLSALIRITDLDTGY